MSQALRPPTPSAQATSPPRTSPPRIERASPADRAFLAMDRGEVPEQFGVLLQLEGSPDLAQVRRLVAERIAAVPRLRQRLVGAGWTRGGPIWVDHPDFDVDRHVRAKACPPPASAQEVLDAALEVVGTRLPRSEPLWAVVLVTGAADGTAALLVVMNHVLADGVGGLAVLAELVDEGVRTATTPFPRPRPGAWPLFLDAQRARLRALRDAPRTARVLRKSFAAAGGVRAVAITPCSLVGPTGPARAAVAVSCDVGPLRAAAHRAGATTNDAVLVSVAGALGQVLTARGEHVDSLVFTVPVSGRPAADSAGLGNAVSPMIVAVPCAGSVSDRLQHAAGQVRARRSEAAGPPPIAVLGSLFRLLARLGGFRWYMNHQRRMHTLVSHVRGPDQPLTFAGHRIVRAIPVAVSAGGNVRVYFEVLTYAGRLTITAVADPAHFPDLDLLARALRAELETPGASVVEPVGG